MAGPSAAEGQKQEAAGSITLEQACDLVKLGPRRLAQLVADGWIKKTQNKYTLVATVHGYIDFLRDEKVRLSQNTAQAEVQKQRARQLAQKADKEAGDLIPAELAHALCAETVGVMMAKIAGLPARLTRDTHERRRIEEIVDEMRNEVANTLEKRFGDLSYADDADPASEEDDA